MFRSLENINIIGHGHTGSHRPSCVSFSTCCNIPPVNVHDLSGHCGSGVAHVGHGGNAENHHHNLGGHNNTHNQDGKRRISTCSGYSTATGYFFAHHVDSVSLFLTPLDALFLFFLIFNYFFLAQFIFLKFLKHSWKLEDVVKRKKFFEFWIKSTLEGSFKPNDSCHTVLKCST